MLCIVFIDLDMVTHPCDTGMNPLWSWCMILFMCDTFLDLVCWDFVEDFCIYIHQRYWPIIFFFGGVFVWFWYQDGGGFIEGHLECFLLFNLLEEFEKDWYKFFLVCLAEFPSEAFLDYCFLFFLFFFFNFITNSVSFWASLVAQMVKNPPAMREILVQSLGQEDPQEKG